MARKSKKSGDFNLPQINSSRSYVSLAYGIVTVVVLFIIIFLGVRSLSQNGGQLDEGAETTGEITLDGAQIHTVEEGETLYSIAENYYQNGDLWPTIAAENSIENPDAVEAGTKLTIPEKEVTEDAVKEEEVSVDEAEKEDIKPTSAPKTTDAASKISGTEYAVVRGDNLWTIAERAYGDGFKWVEIARANKLVNPDLIHAGNKFIIPR